jgi:ketosteroid isomerase-like protein
VKSLGPWDIAPRLARVRVPVLVVHGDEDPMPRAAADAWVAALPDAKLFWMPGAGHSPFVDQPAAFFTAVEGFLDGAWPDAAALAATGVAVVKEGDRARSPYLAARAVVADVENELVRGVGRADWDGVARIYAEDATVFAPGAPPIVGRQAISSYWRTLAKKGMRTLELQPMELEGAGVQMNVVGKYVMRDARDAILDLGKFLAVYRYADGRWQLTRDVLNSSLETRSPLEIPDYLGAARR